MAEAHTPMIYDLEERTLRFTKDIISFVSSLPKTLPNGEIARQLVRSAGSVGANYIEANESLGKKDFLMRIRISRKESKESRYWLELATCDDASRLAQEQLIRESTELMKIFGAILRNSMGGKPYA
jgi:four helix bundle protein